MMTLFVVALLAASSAVGAQQGTTMTGRVTNSLSGDVVAGATISIEGLESQVKSGPDGRFTIENVPPGPRHLLIRADGFVPRRVEVTVASTPLNAEVTVDPQLHFSDVVSVSPDARDQFDSYQPTSVLAGQELGKQLGMSIGDTLQSQPGVAARSFGPAPARPVIRGLDGDRVLILQDGQRIGDLSSQSGDHGVSINPAAAQRIEVVRGPATLLYGANAIGGLVNIITDEIPTTKQNGVGGSVAFDAGTAAQEAGTAADVHVGNGTLALHVGGGGRRSDDVNTPEGAVENSQSRNGFANLGLAWTGSRGYFGGSYGYDDSKYGIPVVEDGRLELTPRRHAFTLRAGAQGLEGAFTGFRATLGVRRYKHEELVGTEVGTAFRNDTNELEFLGSHRAMGRLTGSAGAWLLGRSFVAEGEDALSPAVDQNGFAAFAFEEVAWPHATLQFGGRVDQVHFTPAGEEKRDYTNGSVSVGLLLRPAAASDSVTLAFSLARAARNPALEELFFFGNHHGNFAFEIGNPDLQSEHALGLDVSLRWRHSRASGEITYFRNDISDYIFRNSIDEAEFEEREGEFQARFPTRELAEPRGEEGSAHADEDLAIVEFVGADALLQGMEAHSDLQLTNALVAELGLDYVRGTLQTTDTPLPRIPPFRFRSGLRYQYNALQIGGEVVATAKQGRVSGLEEPTDGYGLLKLYGSYSFQTGAAVNTLTLRLDNATNELYRNHLSLIKEFVPEMGRNFKVLYNLKF